MDMRTHACPGCKRSGVANHLFACTTCWRLLPIELRDAINETYRNRRADRWAHVRAMGAAMSWYRHSGPMNVRASHMQGER
jgi:hypothetical protein